MNAPLKSLEPLRPDQAYEQVARVTNDLAAELARR